VEVSPVADARAEDVILALTAVGLNLDEARRCAAAIFRRRLRRSIWSRQDRDWIAASLRSEGSFAGIGLNALRGEVLASTVQPLALPHAASSGTPRIADEAAIDRLDPLTSEDWDRARQALGKGRKWLLFGTSKKALDDAVRHVQQAAQRSVHKRSHPAAV
jgi:hypothetical protein